MSTYQSKREDGRSRLDGFEIEIFKLVQEEVTSEQWKQWLQVPLEHAAARGNLDLFTRLMDAGGFGGERGWRGCNGRTLLGAAAWGKSDKVVRALLEAGAGDDVNVLFGPEGKSALHVAAARGAEEASKALMVAGADPNLFDCKGYRPLHVAAKTGHDRVISLLLLKGAHVDGKTSSGETPLHLAASKGHALCISELLLGGADKDVADFGDQTPLYKAANYNHLRIFKQLLSAGADRCRTNVNGWSPLEVAAHLGHTTIVKAFLETGSEVDTGDDQGYTAIHCAVNRHGPLDNGAVVRLLLEAGGGVNAETGRDFLRWTPLHFAVERRIASIDTTLALLEGGANTNAHGDHSGTPLHVACMHSNVAAVELLLRWGADETCSNDNGDVPADVIGVYDRGDVNDEDVKADHKRIRRMLARAPADRSWRRRGWLVLSRSCPTRVQIANKGSRVNRNSCPAKVARVSGEDLGGDEEEAENQMTVDWGGLVGSLLGLEADGLFRLVVGFL
ncbi:conserved unknown protein [Ectocarpus siliculosus]|uniref:Uncharacterized protein n=1 Tax=Ectocarpus siliculosus TaxID=2880 RepID=D8LB27_ECTSI|nr:conserved unknown protein [Ectocarpus siliculosus]|eukprot:CBN76536.1 conserved unknown protein [Ectocarpus siliculosus]